MSIRIEVLLWAQRILARKGAPAHELLEIPATASLEAAQDAFHAIARKAHPDLHRRELRKDELESVELAYARVAGAYQDFRAQHRQAMKTTAGATDRTRPRTSTSAPAETVAGSAAQPIPHTGSSPTPRMNSKATLSYRRAELCLRRGDLKGALLQMRLAIAADPQSSFLRSALAELEAELAGR